MENVQVKPIDPYRETKLKASKRYRESHKEYYAEYQRNYYHNKLKFNEDYMKKQSKKAFDKYHKLKEVKEENSI